MKKYLGISIIAMGLGLTACDDFLDKLPDNRTEANTEEKIQKLLVAAYPTHDHMAFTEYASDNVDDMGVNNPYSDRFIDQLYSWEDVTETDDQDPESYWMDLYQCIETANMALEGLESMGGATTKTLREMEAEALLCRAYAHFMLVNCFSLHYDANNPSAPGISYVTETEKELNPQYQRETVQENYKHIQADLEAALPNVGDSYFSVPKYHFNKMAAYAFATRFYLYYEKYDKAIECANVVLGTNPRAMLRDYKTMGSMTRDFEPVAQHNIEATLKCNLLLLTSYSNQPIWFGPYYIGKRYSHNAYIGTNEDINAIANTLWRETISASSEGYQSYYFQVVRYSGTNLNTWVTWRMPYLFEYTDHEAGIGHRHTVYNAFTGDEVLLNRAEAYIMKNDYASAAKDMTIWMQNISRTADAAKLQLTPESIVEKMAKIEYSYSQNFVKNSQGAIILDSHGADSVVTVGTDQGVVSTIKKHLHPKFTIDAEGSVQESMLQVLLAMRRIETLHEGKRWFDIKRWGIRIPRRVMDGSGKPLEITDWLEVDDQRRAIQIPMKVKEAGYEPNPRTTSDKGGSEIVDDKYMLKD
ncbi:MAG: RagB/SusD family nutrient uptake outer membrane protein [Prevotella sp.]|nr:RagB/SusD family nutrient uptake outer membrane protein [Prevotella sp.]